MTSNAFGKAAVAIAAGTTLLGSAYMSYHLQSMEKSFEKKQAQKPPSFSFVNNPTRNEQFNEVAKFYDNAIGKDEVYTGINLMRRFLLKNAKGTVLEMASGTGRNLPFYPSSVKRVVMTDTSQEMLDVAKSKVTDKHVQRFAFLNADSTHLDFLPDNAFDTVVDTFGLCSYDDPVSVLREMARLCKPDGRILLLEHGRSHSWNFVTQHLDKHAEQHAANWGCVWNRNLDSILDEASDSFQVETIRKFHFGTTYYVICKPTKKDA
jgi:methyltransferase OMS1